MDIILKEDAIKKALIHYLVRQGFTGDPDNIEINLIGGRAGSGHRAEITIPEKDLEMELPQYTPHAEVPIAATPQSQPVKKTAPVIEEPLDTPPPEPVAPKVNRDDPAVQEALRRAAESAAEDEDEDDLPWGEGAPAAEPVVETQVEPEPEAPAPVIEKPTTSLFDDDETAEPGSVLEKLQQHGKEPVKPTVTPAVKKSTLFDD